MPRLLHGILHPVENLSLPPVPPGTCRQRIRKCDSLAGVVGWRSAAVTMNEAGPSPDSRTLYNTGFHRCNRRAFPGISRTVKVLFKERRYPVVDVVWDIQLRHLVHQSLMPDGVERLCKVKPEDVDVRGRDDRYFSFFPSILPFIPTSLVYAYVRWYFCLRICLLCFVCCYLLLYM